MVKRIEVNKWDKYGRLLIAKEIEPRKCKSWWQKRRFLCICECWSSKWYDLWSLRSWHTKSCWCIFSKWNTKHWMRQKKEYSIWCDIKDRCTNRNNKAYKYYGWRWVKVFKEWENGFMKFYNYIWPRPTSKHSIDRYPDPNWNYEPWNVRRATYSQQSNNKRNNIKYKDKTLSEWAKEKWIKYHTLKKRLRLWWDREKSLNTLVSVRNYNGTK